MTSRPDRRERDRRGAYTHEVDELAQALSAAFRRDRRQSARRSGDVTRSVT
jgi:hypothetical protein